MKTMFKALVAAALVCGVQAVSAQDGKNCPQEKAVRTPKVVAVAPKTKAVPAIAKDVDAPKKQAATRQRRTRTVMPQGAARGKRVCQRTPRAPKAACKAVKTA